MLWNCKQPDAPQQVDAGPGPPAGGAGRLRQREPVEDDRLDAVEVDQLVEEDLLVQRVVGRGPRRRDERAGHVGLVRVGADELDRVDVVVEDAVLRRGVGHDDRAGPVDRDRVLVAGAVLAGDDLALVVDERGLRVDLRLIGQLVERERLRLAGDRVEDLEVGDGLPGSEGVHLRGGEQLAPSSRSRLDPSPRRAGSGRSDLRRAKLMEDSLPPVGPRRRSPSRPLRRADTPPSPRAAVPDSDGRPALDKAPIARRRRARHGFGPARLKP